MTIGNIELVSVQQTQSCPLPLSPCSIISDPSSFFQNAHTYIQQFQIETNKNIQAFLENPGRALYSLFWQVFGHPMTCSSRVGLISNAAAAASLVSNNHNCFIFSIISSTISHFISMDEAKSTEELERSIRHLEDVKMALEDRNRSLKLEVEKMTSIVKQLQDHNLRLQNSNQELAFENLRLKKNIKHLEETIHKLESHILTLKNINHDFSEQMNLLKTAIADLQRSKVVTKEKKKTILDLQKSFVTINKELSSFSSSFAQTHSTLTSHKQLVEQQIDDISKVIDMMYEKLPSLQQIEEIEIAKQQFSLTIKSLEEYKTQLESTKNSLEKTHKQYKEEHKKIMTTKQSCSLLLTEVRKINKDPTPKGGY